MAKKASVYFGPPLEKLTKDLPPEISVSGKINQAVERYQSLLEEHGLELSDVERGMVVDFIEGMRMDVRAIRAFATNFGASDNAATKVGKNLAARLANTDFIDLVAMFEQLEVATWQTKK